MASISSGAASCSETRWSRPNTISVSVSARIRSSIGSLYPPGRCAGRRRPDGRSSRPTICWKLSVRAVEQLQRAGDALEELRRAPLRRLVVRPGDAADFGHGREAVVHARQVALRFPRIAPRPVDADPPFARRVLAGDVVLVVGAGWHVLLMLGPSMVDVSAVALPSIERREVVEAP